MNLLIYEHLVILHYILLALARRYDTSAADMHCIVVTVLEELNDDGRRVPELEVNSAPTWFSIGD